MIAAKIIFHGLCEEALQFYQEVFGGEVICLERFCEKREKFPMGLEKEYEDYIYMAILKISHGEETCYLSMGDSPVVVFTGGKKAACKDNLSFDLILNNEDAVSQIYEGLMQNGGKANIVLTENEEYAKYGSLIDRFGVCFTLYCPKK